MNNYFELSSLYHSISYGDNVEFAVDDNDTFYMINHQISTGDQFYLSNELSQNFSFIKSVSSDKCSFDESDLNKKRKVSKNSEGNICINKYKKAFHSKEQLILYHCDNYSYYSKDKINFSDKKSFLSKITQEFYKINFFSFCLIIFIILLMNLYVYILKILLDEFGTLIILYLIFPIIVFIVGINFGLFYLKNLIGAKLLFTFFDYKKRAIKRIIEITKKDDSIIDEENDEINSNTGSSFIFKNNVPVKENKCVTFMKEKIGIVRNFLFNILFKILVDNTMVFIFNIRNFVTRYKSLFEKL